MKLFSVHVPSSRSKLAQESGAKSGAADLLAGARKCPGCRERYVKLRTRTGPWLAGSSRTNGKYPSVPTPCGDYVPVFVPLGSTCTSLGRVDFYGKRTRMGVEVKKSTSRTAASTPPRHTSSLTGRS